MAEYSDKDREIARRCLRHLIHCARNTETITYKELAESISEENFRIYPINLPNPLGFIRDRICIHRNLPMINVLTVRSIKKGKGLPGEEFLPGGTSGLEPFGKEYEYLAMRLTEDVFINAHRADWNKLLRVTETPKAWEEYLGTLESNRS